MTNNPKGDGMNQDHWGGWSLTHDGTVLEFDGYRIALADIRDVDGWIEHLSGKGWGTSAVLSDFWHATAALGVGWSE